MTPTLAWRALGLRPYAEVLALQEQLVAQRQRGEGVDTLLLCEHPPVYTLGAGGAVEDVRGVQDVPVYRIGRGGGATFHGPGQLVGYPVLRLRDWGWRVSDYLCALERALIATLRAFGVAAHATDGTHGLWVGERKIASIGIQVSRGIVWHGFALNVACDLAAFTRITPCRQPNALVTSLVRETADDVTIELVRREWIAQWSLITGASAAAEHLAACAGSAS